MATHIKQFFNFLEKKDGRKKPLTYKLIHEPDSLTPEDLHVKGDLNLRGTSITSLPDGLRVDGRLTLYDTKITSLPDNLVVAGVLSLQGTKIARLPKGLVVGDEIFLGDQVTDIPTDIQAKGGIHYHKAPFGEKIKDYTREELKKIYPGVYSFWK